MDRDDKTSIAVFIAEHQNKINEDVNKMIEFGDEIYTGKTNDKDFATVLVKDTWILLLDKEKNNVITLYKIDFGVGDDFNKEYISKMRDKLSQAIEKMEEEKSHITENIEEYRQIIENNKNSITEYNRLIKSLNEQNKMYQDIINSTNTNVEVAEKEVREIVRSLVGKK